MTLPRRIVLLSDFGLSDPYAGILHGVIERFAPGAPVLDLTHGIPAGDIRWGAYTLMTSLRYFPPQSIVVAVVDPGVGSARRGLCLQTADFWLVGPDNGLFSYVLRESPLLGAWSLENSAYFLAPVSQTFHGRDLFAPVAAHLYNGVSAADLGPPIANLVELAWPEVVHSPGCLCGEVLLSDHFGNLITNIARTDIERCRGQALGTHERLACRIQLADTDIIGIETTYASCAPGELLALWGSSDLLEISVNCGNARQRLNAGPGTPVQIRAG